MEKTVEHFENQFMIITIETPPLRIFINNPMGFRYEIVMINSNGQRTMQRIEQAIRRNQIKGYDDLFALFGKAVSIEERGKHAIQRF